MPDIDASSAGAELRAGDDVLSVRGLRKTFPGVVALDAVDFDVRGGRSPCSCWERMAQAKAR